MSGTLSSCNKEKPLPPNPGEDREEQLPSTPSTSIPDALVGTWYADHNEGPLTANWDNKTFQGEPGFREFRTMVFTKDGKNAIEYTSDVLNLSDGEVKQFLYKVVGTLEYRATPAQLTFHAQSGTMRVFSNRYSGYKEAQITSEDLKPYYSVLRNPDATTYASATNYLKAQRFDGGNQFAVTYIKVKGSSNPPTNSNSPYAKPPAAGTYVKIENLYYPTVTIGKQEWMSVNYAGLGGISMNAKPQYGTYYKHTDLRNIDIPAGWRIPTIEDYTKLLASQGLQLNQWGTTDGEDLESKKRLGKLMSATGWKKEDGYATNQSGFNAVPANYLVVDHTPNGEGSNCALWTSEKNSSEHAMAFEIIQLPSDTYAKMNFYPTSYKVPHLPVRFVKDK